MTAPQDPRTQSEALFRRLKADIVQGTLSPGSKLKVDELRERYGAGATPLREALSRLTPLGLVTAIGQRGFRVAEISVEDVLDLTKVRIWVESVALRGSIAKGGDAWRNRVREALSELLRGPAMSKGEDGAIEEGAHREFHAALVGACNSPHLLEYRDRLFDLSERYRWLSVEYASAPRDPAAEHEAIAAATLRGDVDTATTLLSDHFQRTTNQVLRCNPLTSLIAVELMDRMRREIRAGDSDARSVSPTES
jgi:GntR family transcriptional regulator, carbon starvation induced regulator